MNIVLLYLASNLLWLLAGFVAGITSFGGNLVAVPFITLLFEPRVAILAGCISGTMVFLGLCYFYRKNILWKDALFLMSGAAFGIPIGLRFLTLAGEKSILLAAGLALLLFLLWQFVSGKLARREKPLPLSFACLFGFVSGIMMAAVGMGGPPLVLFAFLRNWSKEATLGTVNAVSVGLMLYVLPGQYLSGLYSPQIFLLGSTGAVFALLGIIFSIPVVRKINIALFRTLLLIMLLISAIILIMRAL